MRCLPLLMLLFAFSVRGGEHAQVMPPLAPGGHTVACSNVALDETAVARIGGTAEDFWEGNPQDGQGRYVRQVLAEPEAAVHFDLAVPADTGLYPQFAGSTLAFVTLVCYPTTADNPWPAYRLPDGRLVPHMEPPGSGPLFPDSLAAYPLIVYSHSLGSSPLEEMHASAIERLASYGYVTMAVFHGDARVAPLRLEDLGDLFYLIGNFDHYVELQALRPLALKAALDDLLQRPGYRERVDRDSIGAFGTSLGGEAVALAMGAWLTRNLQLESQPVVEDARIKAAVGYAPYSGLRLLPAFGDDQNGAAHVMRPYLAIGGTEDTTAPLEMTEQAANRMQGSRYLVALAGVAHEYRAEFGDDVFGWAIPFLDAHVREDAGALARLAQTASIAGGLEDSLRIHHAVPPLPRTGLWAIDAEVDGSPGRGFQIDARGDTLVLTFYGYEASGPGRFWLSAGPYREGSFTGRLTAYDGGTAFGGVHRSAHAAGDAGPVELAFATGSHGTITLPGEPPKAISRFVFSPGGGDPPPVRPLPGLWAISAEVDGLPGRGFQIDLQGSTMVLTFFGYEGSGEGRFWLAAGAYAAGAFSGELMAYQGGTPFGGPFRPAHGVGSVGPVTVTFSSESSGTISLPGESPRAVSRFPF